MARVTSELYLRIPENQPRPRLQPTMLATRFLGYPQHNYSVIHITGTNGKTTTARIIERILRELGLRTGRLTSPHLVRINERISIDGEPISDEVFVEAFDEAAPLLALADAELEASGQQPLTFFEAFTALAFQVFSDAPVDVLVLEVGMGGEWDSTNVADADVAVFTAIDLDHQKSLGNTIAEIAATKAGIIKPDSLVVSSPQDAAALKEIFAKSLAGEPLVQGVNFAISEVSPDGFGTRFSYRGLSGSYPHLWMPIMGEHQAQNAATAIAAVEAFLGAGTQQIGDELLRTALADATSPGRLQVLEKSPLKVLDGAHNPAGARALAKAWRQQLQSPSTIGVISMLQEKSVSDTLAELVGIFSEIVVTQADSPRAILAAELALQVEQVLGLKPHVTESVADAWALAGKLSAESESAVLATGSLYLTGNILALIQNQNLEAEEND